MTYNCAFSHYGSKLCTLTFSVLYQRSRDLCMWLHESCLFRITLGTARFMLAWRFWTLFEVVIYRGKRIVEYHVYLCTIVETSTMISNGSSYRLFCAVFRSNRTISTKRRNCFLSSSYSSSHSSSFEFDHRWSNFVLK